jgi:hypothetical protein
VIGRRLVGRSASGHTTGQALVEFALVAPVFFLLLFGIIEGGRFIFYYETLNNATREGARYAIVHGENSSCPMGPVPVGSEKANCDLDASPVRDRVLETAIGMPASGISFPTIPMCPSAAATANPCYYPDNARSHRVKVVARYTYGTLIPLVPLPQITVEAESTLVVNN